LPLAVVALVAVFLRWRRHKDDPVSAREGWSALAALGSCGAAGLLWPAIAGVVVGAPMAYTDSMGAWSLGPGYGLMGPWLSYAEQPANAAKLAVALVLIVGMMAGPWAARLGVVLRTWTLAYAGYLILLDSPSTSLFRHLLPLFPLIVVAIGGGWADRAPRGMWWRTWPLILAGLAGQVWWVWALLRFVPPVDFPP